MRTITIALALASVFLVVGCRNRSGGTATCTPGEIVDVGCTRSLGTVCSGDPTLTICDASLTSNPENCTTRAGATLGYNDDSDGRCPFVTVTCPTSGTIAINPNPFGSSLSWACAYALNRHGIVETSSIETCTPGEPLVIGCDSTVGTLCTGDPTISTCDASVTTGEACLRSAPGFIAFDDDSGDASCPRLTTMCPPSGRIAINANPFGGGMFTCAYAVVRGGVGP